jgi:hypothetical protein
MGLEAQAGKDQDRQDAEQEGLDDSPPDSEGGDFQEISDPPSSMAQKTKYVQYLII